MDEIKDGATIWARQTVESDIFYTKPAAWFKIWFFIINKVSFIDSKQFKRGQGFFTYEWIQNKCKATRSTVDQCIRWLKSATMIATHKKNQGMVVTVLQYDKYQNLSTYEIDTKSDTKSDLKATEKRQRSDREAREKRERRE